jgi:hypothetical protein
VSHEIEVLPAGLGAAGRDALASLLGRVVLDNKVPVVFMELDEGPSSGVYRPRSP